MLLIMSNNGNWDCEMCGAVGIIDANPSDIEDVQFKTLEFVADDQEDNEDYSDTDVTFLEGQYACEESANDLELDLLCSGKPIACAEYEQEDCMPTVYYVVDLEAK